MPFPASALLLAVRSELERTGWKALPADWLNPTMTSSQVRGWTSFEDDTVKPGREVHLWLGQWQNQSGDVVAYSLRYFSKLPAIQPHEARRADPDNDDLEVSATLFPKEAADAIRAGAAGQR